MTGRYSLEDGLFHGAVFCGNIIPNLSLPWVSVIPYANRREARKLGLLRKQKFRSRRRARVAAGANERVCEECPTPIVFLTTNLG